MIISPWLFALVTIVLALNYSIVFLPSLAAYAVVKAHPISLLSFSVPDVLSFFAYPICVRVPALHACQVKPVYPRNSEECCR